jgi:tRNA (mo5U34)-methyltransferase
MTDLPLREADLRAACTSLPWWHSIELSPGIVTEGRKPLELLRQEEEAILGPLRLAGAGVLDVGAWNGHFGFAAERRGAARVLAADSHTWAHRWWRGREGFDIARAALGSRVEARAIDAAELSPETVCIFDIVLLLGVFYHMENPLLVMRRVRSVTRGVLLIETHQDALDQARPMMVFYPGRTLNDDETNWWGPNLALMLIEIGFERVEYRNHPTAGAGRGIYAAFLPGAFERFAGDSGPPWISMTNKGG